jgi:hypothetical protein
MLKMTLSSHSKGDSTMFPLSRNFLKFAAASAIVALTAVSTPSRADELIQFLGPVGPNEALLATIGNKRVIAFYEPDNGHCAVNAVVYDKTDADTGMTTSARVRVSLNSREIVHIDSADNESVKSLNLQCGKNAEKLTIIDTDSLVASGITIQPPSQPIKASASGF